MARKTDVIRVDPTFANAVRKASQDQGIPIIDITAQLAPAVRKRKGEPFPLPGNGV